MILNRLFLTFWMLISVSIAKAQLTSTNLPIAIITTSGAIGNTQIQGTLSIIDNASGVNTPTDAPKFTGMIGVNLKGSSSYPKSSYAVETWSAPTISLDTSLLGMPSDNDWVLLSSYEDRSLVRDVLSFKLHESMGRYASRQKYCELLVNNQYMGIYTFGEKIKRDSLRVDIAKLTNLDNSGVNLTGGYIVKIDGNGTGWTSAFQPPFASTQQIKFTYDYPSASNILPVQGAYIKSYVDSFETALNASNFQDTTLGWRKFAAVNSFADFMIMQELSKNYEAYRKNTYLYKDKSSKLRTGPLWSFESAWKNTASCNGSVDTGWCYNFGGVCGTDSLLPPFWWQKLSTDTLFMQDLKCRYTNYRRPGQILDTAKIFVILDSVKTLLNASGAITRNFVKWPIWGTPIVNEPTPMAANYNEELANFKQFIRARTAWLDTKWTSTSPGCWPTGTSNVSLDKAVTIYPNPSGAKVNVQIAGQENENFKLLLQNIQGITLYSISTKEHVNTIDISNFPKGIYLLSISSSKGIVTKKIVKE